MITKKQIKQIQKIVGDFIIYSADDEIITVIIGDLAFAEKQLIESALGWNQEVIDFVKNTTPEQRKEISRLARIYALEKELAELKSHE